MNSKILDINGEEHEPLIEEEIERWFALTHGMCIDFVHQEKKGNLRDFRSQWFLSYVGELKHYVEHLYDAILRYRLKNLPETARDEIDIARLEYLETLKKHGVSESYAMERHEIQDLFHRLMDKGLIRFEPLKENE